MNQRRDIQEELAETPLLAGANAHMPYAIPVGYFDQFTLQMLKVCSMKNQGAPASFMQEVPEGYFDRLPQQLLVKIKQHQQQDEQEELAQIAPVLLSIDRTPPYHLPENYFQQLQPMDAVQPAKATNMQRLPAARAILWRVAAAVVVVVAALGIWQMSQTVLQQKNLTPVVAGASNERDIDTALLSQAFAQLDDETLLHSLTDTDVISDTHPAWYYSETNNFEDALQSFSSDDLAQHLKEIPNAPLANNQMNL